MSSITATRTRNGRSGDLVAVLVTAVLVVVAAAVGVIARNHDVTIHAATAPLYARWLPHLGPGTAPAVLVGALVALFGPRLAARLSWRALLGAAYLGSLAWTLSLALVDGWGRGVTGRLATPTEYLTEVPRIDDVSTMLGTFADRITGYSPQTWITHVAGHPPGATLVFVGLDRLGLSGGATASVLCILVGASAAVAVAVTLRALGHEAAARAALPFGVLLPGAVWVGVSADGLFAGVLAWGVALFALGATGNGARGAIAAAAGGLVLGGTLYLSYGLVLAGFLPLAVLAITRQLRPLLIATAAVIAVVATFAALGFWWFDGYQQVQQRYYQPGEFGLERPYWYWSWANLAALAIAVGPATAAGLRRLGARPHQAPRGLAMLVGAAVLALLCADLSGLSKAEVERIWLPFAVWLAAATALLPSRDPRIWLALQAVTALVVNHLLLTEW